jgi:hypothetical protein
VIADVFALGGTARRDRDLANNLLGIEPSAGQVLAITSS